MSKASYSKASYSYEQEMMMAVDERIELDRRIEKAIDYMEGCTHETVLAGIVIEILKGKL